MSPSDGILASGGCPQRDHASLGARPSKMAEAMMVHNPLRITQDVDAPPSLRRAIKMAAGLKPKPEDLEQMSTALMALDLPMTSRLRAATRSDKLMAFSPSDAPLTPPIDFPSERSDRRRQIVRVGSAAVLMAASFSLVLAGVRAWRSYSEHLTVATQVAEADWPAPPPVIEEVAPNAGAHPWVAAVPTPEGAGAPTKAVRPSQTGVKPNSTHSAPAVVATVDEDAPGQQNPAAAPPAAEVTSQKPAAPKELSEVQVLVNARKALKTDPAQTLRWVQEHERLFSSGILIQEREVLAIQALRRLNRSAEAGARAARFHERYPTSIHGTQIETGASRRSSGSD